MYPISNYSIVTPPATEPLTVDEAKLHLRVDYADDDTLIASLITAAREHVESATRLAFITRTIDYYRDQFPGIKPWPRTDTIELPLSPVQSVTWLKFTDTYNVVRTWTVTDTDMYNELGAVNAHIDTVNLPGRIKLAYSQIWPNQVLRTVNAVVIRQIVGMGDDASDVPNWAKQAMLMLIGSWYEFRESLTAGTLLEALPVPHGVDMLLAPHKVWSFA